MFSLLCCYSVSHYFHSTRVQVRFHLIYIFFLLSLSSLATRSSPFPCSFLVLTPCFLLLSPPRRARPFLLSRFNAFFHLFARARIIIINFIIYDGSFGLTVFTLYPASLLFTPLRVRSEHSAIDPTGQSIPIPGSASFQPSLLLLLLLHLWETVRASSTDHDKFSVY